MFTTSRHLTILNSLNPHDSPTKQISFFFPFDKDIVKQLVRGNTGIGTSGSLALDSSLLTKTKEDMAPTLQKLQFSKSP